MVSSTLDYTIPSSWKEVTLRQYIELMNLSEELSPSERFSEILVILTGMSPSRVQKLSLLETLELQRGLEWCLTPPKGSFRKSFEHNGKTFAFHPKLENLTTGEFLDLDSYSQNWRKDFHKIFGVLYRPI